MYRFDGSTVLVIKTDVTYTVTHQTTHILPPAGSQNALDESHKKPSAQQPERSGHFAGCPAVGGRVVADGGDATGDASEMGQCRTAMAVDGTGAVGEREDGASEALNGAARDRVAGTNWGAVDRRRGGADGDTEGNAAVDGEAWKARQSGVAAATAAARRWEGIGVAPDADVADEEADKRVAVNGT